MAPERELGGHRTRGKLGQKAGPYSSQLQCFVLEEEDVKIYFTPTMTLLINLDLTLNPENKAEH